MAMRALLINVSKHVKAKFLTQRQEKGELFLIWRWIVIYFYQSTFYRGTSCRTRVELNLFVSQMQKEPLKSYVCERFFIQSNHVHTRRCWINVQGPFSFHISLLPEKTFCLSRVKSSNGSSSSVKISKNIFK